MGKIYWGHKGEKLLIKAHFIVHICRVRIVCLYIQTSMIKQKLEMTGVQKHAYGFFLLIYKEYCNSMDAQVFPDDRNPSFCFAPFYGTGKFVLQSAQRERERLMSIF